MIGGSADLTGSNNTIVKGMAAFDAPDYAGRYVHYGVREFGMAAAMNGMALHGGVIPYSGTFLVFSDYSRPAIRLGALMGVRVIHVMTHDSIGLGEDGPTHQPVEHLASLRAMPNLMVFRPADAVETAECWKLALEATQHALGHGAVAPEDPGGARRPRRRTCRPRGAYELAAADRPAQVTIFASGTEVAVALAARDLLEADGIGDPRRLHPLLGAVRRASPPTTRPQVIGERAGARRRRGRRPPGLGAVHRRGRRLRRHDRLRRPRPRRAALQASSASPPRRWWRQRGGGSPRP